MQPHRDDFHAIFTLNRGGLLTGSPQGWKRSAWRRVPLVHNPPIGGK